MKTTIAAALSGMLLASAMGYAAAAANPVTPTPAPAKQDIFATLSSVKISLDDAIKTAEQTVLANWSRRNWIATAAPTPTGSPLPTAATAP
ncbi:MAG: hypothetical protein HZT40_15085 [Candidatus Thiothrix singaporensis]|uniref:Uncharacterized protein n=1 Tax=Candidatus Thiothrix singaporensis TaxID=2799669 RepID=A0A7L6AUB9_9GAMM|nr:MAG: hypothetical protein HZT40_15085 [Candidatus Thiothrix singaporensis]